jgi:hypothetical protein
MPIAIVDRCYIAQALRKKHFKLTNITFCVSKAKQKAREVLDCRVTFLIQPTTPCKLLNAYTWQNRDTVHIVKWRNVP